MSLEHYFIRIRQILPTSGDAYPRIRPQSGINGGAQSLNQQVAFDKPHLKWLPLPQKLKEKEHVQLNSVLE